MPKTESVWDYPRPPAVEPSDERITVVLGGRTIVDTTDSVRVLETSHPPVYYVPRSAVADGVLSTADGASSCEYKGRAKYLTLSAGGRTAAGAAWYYPTPNPGFEALRDRIAIYPGRMDEVRVAGEVVTPQEGDFYGGWITSRVTGPFKGAPGTLGW
ncbi:DUF427 domain-containing protein [Herbiconiux sp. SYSU D00978]|uniref:DUF427 domain-containing protein n=1 Tax=Herbiconiux sp. SYSU D00978 TaxID=2812562 RepID=UPI001A976E1D|nr:DUF427 domain-containing protein [Herbiconiux sp. SYSU D00978]